jgi:hypothetical protein
MRNLLALFALALLVFAGVGWYLGWYKIQSSPAAEGHHQINVDVDKKKISEDLHRGEERIQKALENNQKTPGSSLGGGQTEERSQDKEISNPP